MHTQATLQTMKRYRIGRIVGQWKNMVPPIQGGIYQIQQEEDDAGTPSDDTSIVTDDDKQDSGIDCDTASDTSSIDLSIKKGPYTRWKG
jgi:hypothetical protein